MRRRRGTPITLVDVPALRELALPFGHIRTVTFTVRQGDEAREIDAVVTADVVAGTFEMRGVPGRFGDRYVKRWSVRITVSPY